MLPAPVAQVDAAAIRHEERGLELFRGFFPAIGKKGALARFLPQGREGLAGKLGEALGFVFPCGGRNGERDGGSLFNGVEGGGETHGAQGEGKVRRGRGVRQEGRGIVPFFRTGEGERDVMDLQEAADGFVAALVHLFPEPGGFGKCPWVAQGEGFLLRQVIGVDGDVIFFQLRAEG